MENSKDVAEEIESFFLAVEESLGVSITFHDLIGAFRIGGGSPLLLKSRTTHTSPICVYAHTRKCLRDCQQFANSRASQKASAFRHSCWKGVDEIVMPLFNDGVHMGTLFAGCFRSEKAPDEDIAPLTRSKIIRMRSDLPMLRKSDYARISRMLNMLAKALQRKLDEIKGVATYTDTRKESIIRYMDSHINQKITLRDVSSHICLSESRACHVVKELFGVSFKSILTNERIDRAKHLLRNSDYPVSDIAERVGFADIHYFSKVFKARTGLPPGVYRRNNLGG